MCRLYCSTYLNLLRWRARMVGSLLTRIRLWASCQQLVCLMMGQKHRSRGLVTSGINSESAVSVNSDLLHLANVNIWALSYFPTLLPNIVHHWPGRSYRYHIWTCCPSKESPWKRSCGDSWWRRCSEQPITELGVWWWLVLPDPHQCWDHRTPRPCWWWSRSSGSGSRWSGSPGRSRWSRWGRSPPRPPAAAAGRPPRPASWHPPSPAPPAPPQWSRWCDLSRKWGTRGRPSVQVLISFYCNSSYHLLHVVIKLHLLLPQTSDKFLGCNGSHFPLLSDDTVEQVSQAGQQSLLVLLVLRLVLQHLVSERFAEVKRLQHWVGVAGVAEIDLNSKSVIT